MANTIISVFNIIFKEGWKHGKSNKRNGDNGYRSTAPEAIAVFQKYGMGCIGCAAAHFENLEAGAKVHGFNPDEMVAEINSIIGE